LNDELDLVITSQSGSLVLTSHKDDLSVTPTPAALGVTATSPTAVVVTAVKGDLILNSRGINDVEVSYGG